MDWVLAPVEVVDPFSLPTPVLISFLEENINISKHSLSQLRSINVLDVWQHLTGLRIRNLVKVVEDCLTKLVYECFHTKRDIFNSDCAWKRK